MNTGSKNCNSMFLPSSKKRSFSPITPKEDCGFGHLGIEKMEYLKRGLLQIHNISQENLRPEIKHEEQEMVKNFDMLRRSILKHEESNRKLG